MNASAILLFRIVRDLDRAGDRILRADLGLSHSRALVLVAIDTEGPSSQQELAAWLGSTAPAVTGLLRELTRAGFVSVTPDPANRRRNRADLTPAGRRMTQAARTLLDERFDALMDAANVDQEHLHGELSRIAAVINGTGV